MNAVKIKAGENFPSSQNVEKNSVPSKPSNLHIKMVHALTNGLPGTLLFWGYLWEYFFIL